MSQQFEFLAQKTIGDDVAGPFSANNSELNPNTKNGRFEGEAKFSENFVSYVDQPDADANWIPVGTVTRVDVALDVLDWDFDKVNGNRAVSFDLWSQGIFPSDTNWTLRWKMTYVTVGDTSSSGNIGNVGIYTTDSSVTSASNQTVISFKFFKGINQTTTNFIGLQSKFNATTNDSFGDVAFDDQKNEVGTFFFELKRTSDTTYEGSIYSDADYTTLIEKTKTTCSASIVDLRYIKIQNDDRIAIGGNSFNGTMDDFSFFNDTEGLQNFLTVKSNTLKTSVFDDSFNSYGSDITPTLSDDFSNAAPWTTTDSAKANIQDEQGFLFFSAVADGTNDAIARDLTSVSDTSWVLRSEFNLTDIDNGGDNIDKRIFFGIFDQDETADAGVNQDGIFLDMRTDLVPGDRIRMSAVNNADPSTSVQLGTFNDTRLVPLLNQKYFVEIKRISTTDMEVGFYTDNTYSDAIEVIRVATLPVAINNLRYLKFMNEPVSGNGKLDLTFKNLDFWNATNVTRTPIADSYVQQGTDIFIDKERSLIDFDANVQNSLQMLTTDVTGATLPSIFTTRFKLVIDQKVQGADATPVHLLIGLSGFDGTQTLNQINSNWIGLRITISNTLNEFRAVGCRSNDFFDNPVTDTQINGGFTTLPDPGTYYFEITRTADINSYVKIWADKDYTQIIEAIKINHGALGGLLRYFKVGNGDNGDGTEDSTLIGTVDDVRLWENIRDPDGYGAREYYHQSSLVKFGSGTMQVAEIVSGDNASNPVGNEYKNRFSLNGGADTGNDDNEGTMATGMVNSDVFIESFMNQGFKTVNSLALAANVVGSNVPDKMVGIWRYQEFPELEKLTLINSTGGLYGTGSRTTVWGSIP